MQRHGLPLLALIFFLCLPLSARLVTPAAASAPRTTVAGQGTNPNELLIFEVNHLTADDASIFQADGIGNYGDKQ